MTWPPPDPPVEPAYTYPPPTTAPPPGVNSYGPEPIDPVAYYPPGYPFDPWTSMYQSGPRTAWPTFKSVVTLGWFVMALIAVVIGADVLEIIARVRDYRLIDDLRSDLASVSIDRIIDQIDAVDDFKQASGLAFLAAFIACGIVFITWFYRVRWNAEAYGTHEQRRGQGWAIGSWICPVIAFFYPYQMTNDALIASEASREPMSAIF